MNRASWWQIGAASLFISGIWLWFFGPVLLTADTLAFRDAGHFYYPLFQWINTEWSAGRIPLWNPQENCGMPILADTTSSVFYPGKLVFIIPGLDFATRFELYIALHVLLAAAGAYRLARSLQTSRPASCAAAVSYGFCGNVLFQYCNVVFLVGAAWLPFAVLAAHRMLCRRQIGWSLVLGAVLALMTLGGDPQSAYHAGLMAVLLAGLLWVRQKRCSPNKSRRPWLPRFGLPRAGSPWRPGPLTTLSCAALTGALLAAVQILPAVEWSGSSSRSLYENPRNIYEAASTLYRQESPDRRTSWQAVRRGLLSQPTRWTHHDSIYQFSVGPWRLAELIWPGASGRMFPVNHRWMGALRWEGRVWTPSIYMGLLPFVLALCAMRFRGGTIRRQWISWCVLLAALGALGEYGGGWILHQLRGMILTDAPGGHLFGRPVGGLYWLLVTFMPGYASFRYPAKLLVVAALGLSMLSALGWDRVLTRRPARAAVIFGVFAFSSMLLAGIFYATKHAWWSRWLELARPKIPFGPLNDDGAATDLMMALVHTSLLSLCLVVIFVAATRLSRRKHSVLAFCALAVTAVDLSIAHRWLIPTVPAEIWDHRSLITQRIFEHNIDASDSRHTIPVEHHARRVALTSEFGSVSNSAYRVYRGSSDLWYVPHWRQQCSSDRIYQWMYWDRATLKPRFHLLTQQSMIGSYGSMVSRDFQVLMDVAKERGIERPDRIREPHPAVLRALSVRYLIMPRDLQPFDDRAVTVPLSRDAAKEDSSCRRAPLSENHVPQNVALWKNAEYLPRAWIVHEVHRVDPIQTSNPTRLRQRTDEVFFVSDRARNLRDSAVVECERSKMAEFDRKRSAHLLEKCRIVREDTQSVEIETALASSGLLVLNDLFYPGWTAEVLNLKTGTHHFAPVIRTNRVMRGVFLSPGTYRIRFRYGPVWFYTGAVLSLIGWLALPCAWTLAQRNTAGD